MCVGVVKLKDDGLGRVSKVVHGLDETSNMCTIQVTSCNSSFTSCEIPKNIILFYSLLFTFYLLYI